MSHTPTPWKHIPGMIFGAGKTQVASTGCEQGIFAEGDVGDFDNGDNAEFIVLACNSHDALVAALNKIASWDEGPEVGSHFDSPNEARIAREALATLKGAK